MDWTLQSLRVTAFVRGYVPLRGLWAGLVGAQPEEIVDKPRDGSYTESGLRTEHQRLIVSWGPGRTQLDVQAAGYPADLFAVLPRAPDLFPADFRDVARTWLARLHEHAVMRVALGAVLLSEQKSSEATYESMQPLLPDVKLDPRSTDLTYRINRPRVSGVVDRLKINRISMWQAISLQHVVVDPALTSSIATTLGVAARLELDINTDAERDQRISVDDLPRLVDELVHAAHDIAMRGDLR